MTAGGFSFAEAAPSYTLEATCDIATHTMHYVSNGPAVGRYYDAYQGIVGYGELMNGSSAGNVDTYDQVNTCDDEDDSISPTLLHVNSYWFAAVFPATDVSAFRDYFTGVTGSPPNNNYGVALCNTAGCTALVNLTIGTSTALGYFDTGTASGTYDVIGAQCSGSGNIFSYGICTSFAFLFVPSPDVLNNWSEIATTTQSKFPFSWIKQTKATIDALSASASTTPTYTIGLHDLGIGSTTAMGNVMPNITALSSSTIHTYIPDSAWNAMQLFMVGGLWVLLGIDIFYTIRRRHANV